MTPEEPIPINQDSQLFVDDHLIANISSVHRRLNRPDKQPEPIMVADRKWEGIAVYYGSVLQHRGQLWLYYITGQGLQELNYSQFRERYGYGKHPICLASSKDGHVFHKEPIEGAVLTGTNIVIDDPVDCFGLVKDELEKDPSKRFKLLASRGNWWAGLTPATSPDGIQWTWGEPHAVTYFGDRCSYWIDPIRKKHVAWSRCYPLMGGRVIVHKETEDFDRWGDIRESHPKIVMMPDRNDHPMTQYYGGYAFWYRSLYLAYLEVYYVHSQRIDTLLASSRDGLRWQIVCDRDIFLPNGRHGEFDAYWIVPTFNPPVLKDGQLLIHYNGRPDPHGHPGFESVRPGMGGSIGLATLREDGFVSLDATGAQGNVETKLLKLPEARSALEINVGPFNTRPGYDPMEVLVELLNESGESLISFPIQSSSEPNPVWFRISLKLLLPQVLRLRFRLRNARLYSFRFVADQPG